MSDGNYLLDGNCLNVTNLYQIHEIITTDLTNKNTITISNPSSQYMHIYEQASTSTPTWMHMHWTYPRA